MFREAASGAKADRAQFNTGDVLTITPLRLARSTGERQNTPMTHLSSQVAIYDEVCHPAEPIRAGFVPLYPLLYPLL